VKEIKSSNVEKEEEEEKNDLAEIEQSSKKWKGDYNSKIPYIEGGQQGKSERGGQCGEQNEKWR